LASVDSLSLVIILFSLALMGVLGEFFIYMAHEIGDGLTNKGAILDILSTLEWVVNFIHSNFFILALSLALVNLVIAGRSSLNPVWIGVFSVFTFLLFWFMNYYIIPLFYSTLFNLETSMVASNMNWAEQFQANWYMLALSGVAGTIIGYIKGAKNTNDYYRGIKRGGRWGI